MSISFKHFSKYVSLTDDELMSLSEEQLNEIWPFTDPEKKKQLELERQKLLAQKLQKQKEIAAAKNKQKDDVWSKYKLSSTQSTAKDKFQQNSTSLDIKAGAKRAVDRDPFGTFESKK